MSQTHRLPFRMRTVFQDLFLVTYAVPPAALAALLPAFVHPYIHRGQSFISIVIANMRAMRPAALPELFGASCYQIVYRSLVEIRPIGQPPRRGVFFLRSDCNDPLLGFFGNQLTEFRFHYFHTGAMALLRQKSELLVSVETQDRAGDLVLHLSDLAPAATLPCVEQFDSLAEEKEILVDLFNAFSYDPDRRVVYDMEVERGEWALQRLRLNDGFAAFFEEQPFSSATARHISSLYIRECAYVWKPMIALNEAMLSPQS